MRNPKPATRLPHPVLQNIATNIGAIRKRRGLTQEQLSDLTHIAPQTLSRFERNLNTPSISKLASIADGLQVEISSLINDNDQNQSTLNHELMSALRALPKSSQEYIIQNAIELCRQLQDKPL